MTAIMISLGFRVLTDKEKYALDSIFSAFNYLQVENLNFLGTIVFSNCTLLTSLGQAQRGS